jgi:hypothetical protein
MSWPWMSCTMPTMTRTTAMIHKMKPMRNGYPHAPRRTRMRARIITSMFFLCTRVARYDCFGRAGGH